MSFIQENQFIIDLNLKKEYRIVHFSDVHAINLSSFSSPEDKENAYKIEQLWMKVKKESATYHHEVCAEEQLIPSSDCFDHIINYVNEVKPNAVVMTGDVIDYYSEANFDLMIDEFAKINYPYVFTCGNHESPAEQYDDISMSENGFTVLELYDFKIIGLDNSTKKISLDTLKKFKKELRSKKPILVAMHIPIKTSYNAKSMEQLAEYYSIDYNSCDETTKEFIKLLIESDQVKAILCGHIHHQASNQFAPNKMQYCASCGIIGYVNYITIR